MFARGSGCLIAGSEVIIVSDYNRFHPSDWTFQKSFTKRSVMYNLKIFSLIWPFPLLIKLFQFSLIFPPTCITYFRALHLSHSGILKKVYVCWTYLNILELDNSIFLLVQAYRWYVSVPKMTQYLLIHIIKITQYMARLYHLRKLIYNLNIRIYKTNRV